MGDLDHIVDLAWARDVTGDYPVTIRAFVNDQRGLLARLTTEIAESGANIANIQLERAEGEKEVNIQLTLDVRNRDHLARVMRALRRIPEAMRIQRVRAS